MSVEVGGLYDFTGDVVLVVMRTDEDVGMIVIKAHAWGYRQDRFMTIPVDDLGLPLLRHKRLA